MSEIETGHRDDADGHWVLQIVEADPQGFPGMVLQKWRWYMRSARRARIAYYLFELSSLLVAAAIPVSAIVWNSATVAAVLGAILVVVTGVRQFAGWHDNWMSFAQARYKIEREIALYSMKHGPYAETTDPRAHLCASVLEIADNEGQEWSSRRARMTSAPPPGLAAAPAANQPPTPAPPQ